MKEGENWFAGKCEIEAPLPEGYPPPTPPECVEIKTYPVVRRAEVSGSGPTCAFLVSDETKGLDLAVALTSSGLCRTVRRAEGPVSGARVIDQRTVA